MTEDERQWIEQEILRLKGAARFLSQAGKIERERLSCAMFLRALGVPFACEELIAVLDDGPPDYIDVKFREARFQVREVLDKDRRRQDEMKARLRRYKQARQDWRSVRFRDVVELSDRPAPYPMSYSEVYARLSAALAEKAFQYTPQACAALDALGVIQLKNRYPDCASPLPDDTALRQQGWRSVSFVMAMYSHVVYATDVAPTFLQPYVRQTRREWKDASTFYYL
jgi:hypothetical protein